MEKKQIKSYKSIEEKKKFENFKNIFLDKNSQISNQTSNKEITTWINNLENIKNIFIQEIGNDFGITEEYYPYILNQMEKLAVELKLSHSLELSNLYTYLLWNGYLSKNKKNIYSIENEKLIKGLYFMDIMDGKGICINHADMLKDFLIHCGYNSSLMFNLMDKNTKYNYKLDIDSEIEKQKKETNLFITTMESIINNIGNNVFNLIEDNGQLYIYDSTNLMLLRIKNPHTAEMVNGKGTYQLNPYFSYIFNNNREENYSIYRLFMTNDYSCPYNRNDIIYTGEDNIETFKNNQPLIEDFYSDIRGNLVNISEAKDKIIKVKKR